MIWASDAAGHTTYLSPQWEALTGQPVSEAKPFGWMQSVHSEDREATQRMFQQAIAVQKEFWSVYRLCNREHGYIWVVDGATPSFGQVHGEFLGFLGSVTEIDPPVPPRASGEIGFFRPPPIRESTKPLAPLDMITDLAIVARMIAREAGETALVATFEDVLRDLGARLGAAQSLVSAH